MKALVGLIIFVSSTAAQAAPGHGHGDGGIPITMVLWQLANVLILFGGIFYLTRKTIIESFAKRRSDYLAASEKSQSLKQAAEQELRTVLENLSKLKTTSEDSIRRAHAEAAELKNNLIKEAHELSMRIKKEAADSAAAETRRAKLDLTQNFLGEAFQNAESQLKGISAQDKSKLQTQFVENMKVSQQ